MAGAVKPFFHYLFIALLLFNVSCKLYRQQRLRQKREARELIKAGNGNAYYVNTSGNDNNAGGKNDPWKTISKLNTVNLGPGDTVYLAGKQTFPGTLKFDGVDTGWDMQPIVITSYGEGEVIIDGGAGSAVQVNHSGNIAIRNLRLAGAGRKGGNTENGLSVMNSRNIIIDHVDISGFQKAGLMIYKSSGVRVTHVYAHENGFAGISVSGSYANRDCKDIYIGYCRAEDNPGDPANKDNHSGNGIIAGYCKKVTIEYCTATNNGWDMPRTGNGPVGIWAYEADSVVIQHCLSYRNKTSVGGGDGGGFDLDGGVTHSVIQYCLSYENQGSGYGIFQYAGAAPWHDNTFRYNISENDGDVSAAGAGVYIWNSSADSAQFKDCLFYNNVVYNTRGAAIRSDRKSLREGFRFYNNIFIGAGRLVKGKIYGDSFLANDWWSLSDTFNINGIRRFRIWAAKSGQEQKEGKIIGLNQQPGFPDAGHATITAAGELKTFFNYQLSRSALFRTAGLHIETEFGISPGGLDFNGGAAPEKGIGASF